MPSFVSPSRAMRPLWPGKAAWEPATGRAPTASDAATAARTLRRDMGRPYPICAGRSTAIGTLRPGRIVRPRRGSPTLDEAPELTAAERQAPDSWDLSDRDGPRDECGVFGIYAPGRD